ncbi:MAG: OmpP1/FadL family transporter [Desulfobacterales bacterium]
MRKPIVRMLTALVLFFAGAAAAHAGMGNIATNYGVLPADMASAQALSIFGTQAAAAYYNPANLVRDNHGQFTTGLFYADHSLEGESKGGSEPLAREGDVINDTASRNLLLGMKTDLSDLTRQNHPISFGFMAGVEKYGMEMLAFNSETSKQGQYFSYDRQPLFIRLGAGTRIWRGIDAGVGASIELHNEAELQARTDLAGNTEHESLSVSTEPDLQAIFGLTADLEETLCPDGSCWLDGTEMAFSYREASYAKTSVKANTVIPGTIPEPGLDLAVATIDSYKPEMIACGISWSNEILRVGLAVEQQFWSELEDEFADDTIKDQVDWDFKDVIVPRLGVEYRLADNYTLISGVAFEESALDSNRSLDVNYLDTDRWIAGLGISARFRDPWILAYPLRLDLGYQYHWLKERDFELTHTEAPSNPYETITAKGEVHVVAGAITLTF